MNRLEAMVVPAIAALLVACSVTPAPTASVPGAAPPAPFQRTFGPVFAAVAPSNDVTRIDAAVLSRDRRNLSAAFIGGQAYAPANPCSQDYGAWAGISGDTLDVQVHRIAHADQATMAPGMACTAEGHPYLFQILLPVPFRGPTVRDVATGLPLWIAPPDGVAELVPVPSGWRLTFIATESSTRELDREYRPGADSPGDDNRYLYLAQVFGGPSSHPVDEAIATRSIRGQDVDIGRNGDGFIVNWRLGADTLTLITDDATVDLDAFVAVANAVAVPAP